MNLLKWKKFIVCSDTHGDCVDQPALNKFLEFNKQFEADIRVHAGDLFDFRGMRLKASEEEKSESMEQDFQAGIKLLEDYKPNYYLKGNHCDRLDRLAGSNNGMIRDAAQSGIKVLNQVCKNNKIKVLPYHKRDGVLKIGHLKILHGFYCGLMAAKQHALVYGSCLFGHVHTSEEYAIPRMERTVARSIGCLAKLDMQYNKTMPSSLRHTHGFAYGAVNPKSGSYFTIQAECIEGTWFTPSL
jgi:predicted phosphodiesterase